MPSSTSDPPYYVKGEGLCENYYQHADHAEIAALVLALEVPWVVSYDATDEIRAMYDGATCITYDLHYSAADRTSGSEVMFFSQALRAPDDVQPAGVPSEYVASVRRSRRTTVSVTASGKRAPLPRKHTRPRLGPPPGRRAAGRKGAARHF